jgi:hypothetical protein
MFASGRSYSTKETVVRETPARVATSRLLDRRPCIDAPPVETTCVGTVLAMRGCSGLAGAVGAGETNAC